MNSENPFHIRKTNVWAHTGSFQRQYHSASNNYVLKSDSTLVTEAAYSQRAKNRILSYVC